jgi:trans-aconitate methyltransferase
MVAEARRNAEERALGNVTFEHVVEGTFDLVHSHMVLQHIPPRRGMGIVSDLAARINEGGMIVLQVPYYRDAAAWRKLVTAAKRTQPVINGALNVVQGRRYGYPTMTMFCYDVSRLFAVLRSAGFKEIRAVLQRPYSGYESVVIYAQRG